MSLWRQLAHGFRALTSGRDRDLTDEVEHYLDEAAAAYVAQGLSPEDARRAARRDFGSPAAVKDRIRSSGWESVVEALLSDVRFASRMLCRSPMFAIVVVLVVSIGSGAVTTIFSAMNGLVLRPVPGVVEPDRLVTIRPVGRDGTIAQQGSYATYARLRDSTRTLDGVAAWGRVAITVAAGGQGTAVFGNMVSAGYFDVLGVRPALGRFFRPEEDRTPLAHPVIVVSHAFWTARLGGADDAIGRTVLVNGEPYTLVGVAPPRFRGVFTGLPVDAWVPLMMQPHLRPRSNLGDASWLWLFGRLRDGDTLPAAAAELSIVAQAAAPQAPAGAARPFDSFAVAPLTGLPNGEAGPIVGFLTLLLGAAVLLLVISGVNVAAMFSARGVARRREMAVRAALGAGRGRLVRQLLTEVLMLFAAGALGGFAIAAVATRAVQSLPLPVTVPLSFDVAPDTRVLAFAVSVSLLAGLLFGLAPALRAVGADITSRLRDDSAGAGIRRTLPGRAIVAGQLALCLVLLVGAGLFTRALHEGRRVDPGFDLSGVTVASFEPESWGYAPPKAREFYRTLRERTQRIPGVAAVSLAGRLPLTMGSSPDDVTLDDGSMLTVHTAIVDVDYFPVLRLPLVGGRAFLPTDNDAAPPVAVVNETLARRLRADGRALDHAFRFRDTRVTIVGIARDAKYASLDERTPPFAYFPVAQHWQPAQSLLVRAAPGGPPPAPAIREAVLSIDPLLPPPRIATLEQATAFVLLPQRAAAVVTGILGAAGLLLASVGLYGTIAFAASRRTRELGIRVALGASPSSLRGMVVREGLRLAAAGIVVGLPLAAASTRLLSAWLFGVSPLDPGTFALMSAVLVAIGAAASYLPARRAAALDPVSALRAD